MQCNYITSTSSLPTATGIDINLLLAQKEIVGKRTLEACKSTALILVINFMSDGFC